jgi:hypothetical protein
MFVCQALFDVLLQQVINSEGNSMTINQIMPLIDNLPHADKLQLMQNLLFHFPILV